MRSYLKSSAALAVAVAVAVVTACGTGGARQCTAIAARQGIGLDIPAPYAAKVADATMKICWNGACREPDLHLAPTSRTVPQGCTGDAPDDVCGAVASPDGGKHGFADLQQLPATPVQVTIVLRDIRGAKLLDQKIDVTPHVTYPNGRECGEGDPQAMLVVTNGKVGVRP